MWHVATSVSISPSALRPLMAIDSLARYMRPVAIRTRQSWPTRQHMSLEMDRRIWLLKVSDYFQITWVFYVFEKIIIYLFFRLTNVRYVLYKDVPDIQCFSHHLVSGRIVQLSRLISGTVFVFFIFKYCDYYILILFF